MTGSLRDSVSSLTPNQAQFRSFGLCFSELINNSDIIRRMKMLASCPVGVIPDSVNCVYFVHLGMCAL